MIRILLAIFILFSCGNRQVDCVKGCPQVEPTPTPEVGPQGEPGTHGVDGKGCSVEKTDVGAEVTCDNETVVIRDGAQGETGKDGVDGKSGKDGIDGKDGVSPIDKVVALCGSTQPHAEIAMRVNGRWVAYFENQDGSNRRLTVLSTGVQYMSTDGIQSCLFTTDDLERM